MLEMIGTNLAYGCNSFITIIKIYATSDTMYRFSDII
jgi:hypothetical protein